MEKFDWNAALGSAVPAEWLLTKGEGVKIAVIDTGVDLTHPDLLHLKQKEHTFYPASTGFSADRWRDFGNASVPDLYNQPPDPPGHGTQCVSILAARPAAGDASVQGIAPNAEVYIIKTTNASGLSNSVLQCFLDALKVATAIKPDIILASLAIHKIGLARERIQAADADAIFKAVSDNNILLFSSIKNAGSDARSFEIGTYYPSSQPESINTVAMPSWLATGLPNLEADNELHFMVNSPAGMICKPGNKRTGLPQVFPNSYANYVMGGVAALYLSFLKKITTDQDLSLTKDGFLTAMHSRFSPLADAVSADKTKMGIFRNFNLNQPNHV